LQPARASATAKRGAVRYVVFLFRTLEPYPLKFRACGVRLVPPVCGGHPRAVSGQIELPIRFSPPIAAPAAC